AVMRGIRGCCSAGA
uniref:Uncharacterized protein n=1 Tax=Strongyloides stercoralis TaxID=6248 RepID=A0A0K0E088_STRER